MNRVNKSILIFGIYSLVMGMVLLFIPQYILPIFSLPILGEPWLNLLGFVLLCSSYYYVRSSFSNHTQFAVYTTHTRFAAPLVVAYLIFSGKADWHFLSFGIFDGLGGLWTLYELKKWKS
ncbi:MAG: hypothetical protein MUC49_22715 [Raineya sp.]|jgi:hypothetical protein|nr:hypothetical protein [Raineya sp.]